MLRAILSTLPIRVASSLILKLPLNKSGISNFISKSLIDQQKASFTSLVPPTVTPSPLWIKDYTKSFFLKPQKISSQQIRTVIKFSLKKGKRKTVKNVLKRFYRLNWGIWIRTMAGRHKKLWKKSASQRNRLKNHVFCNATQSMMLDKMVNKFWRKPKYYIDEPYDIYHKRENFYITQTKPWRPQGVDYE